LVKKIGVFCNVAMASSSVEHKISAFPVLRRELESLRIVEVRFFLLPECAWRV
jgi:hypothetical protein